MAKRKRATLIRKEGTFRLGFIDEDSKELVELWQHNGFYYKLTKKTKICCEFTDSKYIVPILMEWFEDFTKVYNDNSKIDLEVKEVVGAVS